ncbi:MAG TPA: endonuclease III [Candidatus Ozemobacteraceae bacterium]|nr:endonuclease III [Candidatus Ozemobacteraceae bacterium]HQG28523.1 endonuclease III [Candidatus Ozemobacteraceae bacterium]
MPAKRMAGTKTAAAAGTKAPARGKHLVAAVAPKAGTDPVKTAPARVPALLESLFSIYPDPHCALKHENPLQLLVSTILSAQCTDERVNMVTATLFEKYRTAADFARADQTAFENDIRSTGFFRNKAKNIISCAKALVEKHGGMVPKTLEELVVLPGVGRKTANVVLGTAFGIASGVVVDTHVTRLSWRLGLTNETDAEKIEADLMKLIPRNRWIAFSHAIILHGRARCSARTPDCAGCELAAHCPKRL